uniref:Sushi domain-containing protein n=1 Tax=Anas zonorhyncha TaxID=75864 RepID=A0A8B9UL82_9AVES
MVTAVTTIARLCTLVSRSELTAWVPISVSIVHLISERMAHYYFPKRIGQYVDYYCHNGYLAPNGERVVRIYCSKGGWNPEPKCLKTCSVTHLENGYFRYNHDTYTEGERIQYACNPDYRTESAGGEVTCTKNGWSPFPRCIRKIKDTKCGYDLYTLSLETDTWYIFSVEYYYLHSFQLIGGNEITCINGRWQSPPRCVGQYSLCCFFFFLSYLIFLLSFL